MYFDVKHTRSTGESMFVFSFDTREEYEQMLKDLQNLAESFDESSDSRESLLKVANSLEKRYTERYNDTNLGHACSTFLFDNEIALGFTTLYITSAALHEAIHKWRKTRASSSSDGQVKA